VAVAAKVNVVVAAVALPPPQPQMWKPTASTQSAFWRLTP